MYVKSMGTMAQPHTSDINLDQILGDGGMNVVRLRLWVDPKAPYDGKICAVRYH